MNRLIAVAISMVFLCSCEQLQELMKPKESSASSENSSSSSNYDPVANLSAFVMPEIKLVYVDVAKAEEGSSATRDMGNNMTTTVAVVGKMDGKTLVEISGSMMKDYASNKPAVVALLVDGAGKVHKAWGGLAGTEGVALKVPEVQKVDAVAGEKIDVKTEDLASVTLCGVSGEGKKYTTKHGSSSTWTNKDFPFFGGVIQTEAGGAKMVLSSFAKSGAKAQLTVK